LLGLLLVGMVIAQPWSWRGDTVACCGVPLLLVAFPLWLESARTFRNSCQGKSAWKDALLRYHAYAVPLTVLVVLLVGLGTILPGFFPRSIRRYFEPFQALILLIMLVVVTLGGHFAHRRVKKIIQPLQREVAVEMAKQVLRDRLTHSGR